MQHYSLKKSSKKKQPIKSQNVPNLQGHLPLCSDEFDIVSAEACIGHKFSQKELLIQSLTHRSYSQEIIPPGDDNERLEFLGDAVLQLVVTDFLWNSYPDYQEGQLTRQRSLLVNGRALAKVAKLINFAPFIRLGKGEKKTGGQTKNSILAGTFEAIVGAIFIDAGFKKCANWIHKKLLGNLPPASIEDLNDNKSKLQEFFQSSGQKAPEYKIINEFGPEHSKVFTVEVLQGNLVLGRGEGRSKKAAEQEAAKACLKKNNAV
tara:strand:- start:6726 stop:7511 length:786 start_codon:yes stop_codon:yes gene_type:complete